MQVVALLQQAGSGLQQDIGALVVGQQPQVDDDLSILRDAQHGALSRQAFLLTRAGRIERVRVDAVRHRAHLVGGTAEFLDQKPPGVMGAGQDHRRPPVGFFLQKEQGAVEQALAVQELVVQHLGCQAALKVENHGDTQQPANHKSDQRALVHVGVDDVGSLPQRGEQHRPKEEKVKGHLVQRGADLIVLAKRNGGGAPDRETRQVLAVAVGADHHPVAQPLQRPDLFQDAHRAPIVGKEGGRRDHQNRKLFCSTLFSAHPNGPVHATA